MKFSLFLSHTLLLLATIVNAQTPTLNIADCYRLAEQNYPLIKKQELIQKSRDYSLQSLSKAYLPQFNIHGQASYQSEVTQIPIQIPENEIPSLDKDQYKLYGELTQILFDGGVIKTEKESQEISTKIEEQQLKVELYQLKSQINQLYFGILLIDQQLKQNSLLKEDIQLGIKNVQASIQNGTALKSSSDALQAEYLKAEQQGIEMKADRKAFIKVLGMFVGRDLSKNTVLASPSFPIPAKQINRPELDLFDFQNRNLEVQKGMLRAKNRPKFDFFAQGGAGRPALNMLSNDFDAYYLVGLRMSIPISGFYTLKNDRALLSLRQRDVDVQQEVFLFNTEMQLKKQSAEIAKYQELLSSDDEIITLRANIKKTALVQLENGVISSNDYIKETVAENQARQQKGIHEIQLLMALYNQKITEGN